MAYLKLSAAYAAASIALTATTACSTDTNPTTAEQATTELPTEAANLADAWFRHVKRLDWAGRGKILRAAVLLDAMHAFIDRETALAWRRDDMPNSPPSWIPAFVFHATLDATGGERGKTGKFTITSRQIAAARSATQPPDVYRITAAPLQYVLLDIAAASLRQFGEHPDMALVREYFLDLFTELNRYLVPPARPSTHVDRLLGSTLEVRTEELTSLAFHANRLRSVVDQRVLERGRDMPILSEHVARFLYLWATPDDPDFATDDDGSEGRKLGATAVLCALFATFADEQKYPAPRLISALTKALGMNQQRLYDRGGALALLWSVIGEQQQFAGQAVVASLATRYAETSAAYPMGDATDLLAALRRPSALTQLHVLLRRLGWSTTTPKTTDHRSSPRAAARQYTLALTRQFFADAGAVQQLVDQITIVDDHLRRKSMLTSAAKPYTNNDPPSHKLSSRARSSLVTLQQQVGQGDISTADIQRAIATIALVPPDVRYQSMLEVGADRANTSAVIARLFETVAQRSASLTQLYRESRAPDK